VQPAAQPGLDLVDARLKTPGHVVHELLGAPSRHIFEDRGHGLVVGVVLGGSVERGTEARRLSAMGAMSDLLYGVYERRLAKRRDPERLPHHVGAIVDGNRRWARGAGAGVDLGYQAGAEKITEFLGWCDELDVNIVTL